MPDINLSKAVPSKLLSLQSTAAQMAKTQERLATGLKVNSALDNPTNFFTASSLNSRAGDMANLLDSMSNGIKTIEAADNGLSSITKTVESMQSTLRQARQDKSFKTMSYLLDTTAIGNTTVRDIELSGGAIGTTPVSVELNAVRQVTGTGGFASAGTVGVGAGAFTITSAGLNGGAAVTVTAATTDTVDLLVDKANAALSAADGGAAGFRAVNVAGQMQIISDNNTNFTIGGTVTGTGIATGAVTTATATEPASVDVLVARINANAALAGKVRASNDSGKLRIENLSTTEMTVTGVGADGEIDGGTLTSEVQGNSVRRNLVTQFNDLRDQLDKFSDDASFNGINLLRGDNLKLTFNETGSSTIDIQAKNEDGDPISVNNATLNIDLVVDADFDSDETIDAKLDILATSLGSLRSLASSFGSNLSIVENRTDFTKKMINTLETGAANLTLADANEEAANLLALQTRQQLSSTALSMASQADQAVLRLF
ncbi:MAG: flagellin [Devosia sp.]